VVPPVECPPGLCLGRAGGGIGSGGDQMGGMDKGDSVGTGKGLGHPVPPVGGSAKPGGAPAASTPKPCPTAGHGTGGDSPSGDPRAAG